MTGMMRIDDRKGNSMIFIGITGGVGAGKSAVLSYLKELDGVRVMLSDEIAHELMEPGSDCYNRLKGLFAGEPIWLEDGHFDRPALAGVIFSNEKKRELLNEVVHPAVKEYVLNAVKEAKKEGLLVGVSAGANVHVATSIASRPENKGKTVVTILCDTGERYLSTGLYEYQES
jgi:dephospho-CoA kinase